MPYGMRKYLPVIDLDYRDWMLLLIMSVPAFYMLGIPAIYIWDEAVYVNASFDMAHGASWFMPVDGTYNTKPPLVLWLQAICLKILPSAEWAVRLPSAFAVSGILFMLCMGLKRWGFDIWARMLVMICFVGHEGFIRHHIARTGDLDAVMTFCMVGYVMVVLDALHHQRWTGKHNLFFFVMLVLSFYAKSIAGWMMLAPLGLVWVLSPARQVFVTRRFWLSAMLSAGICVLYYLIREMMQPGFFSLVWKSEYQRMFVNVMPWHEHGADYYFTNFVTLRTFSPWVFVLVALVIYSLFGIKTKTVRQHLVTWMILAFGYLLFITIPAVKLEWYDAPAYPFFALIMGVSIHQLIRDIPLPWKLFVLIPVALIIWRKLDFIQNDIHPRHPFEFEGAILRQASLSPQTKVFMHVEHPEHRLQLDFYRKVMLKEKGIQVDVLDQYHQLAPGQKLIVSQAVVLDSIQKSFLVDTLVVYPGLGYEVKINNSKE
jgi:4-amino-4-deoxy-L-arabinose transferase-like glycosyltransferase